jgi:hypothetical protein
VKAIGLLLPQWDNTNSRHARHTQSSLRRLRKLVCAAGHGLWTVGLASERMAIFDATVRAAHTGII